MRTLAISVLAAAIFCITTALAQQKDACKVCGDQQRACMKNYTGPACKTEYQMCLKSCRSKP